MPVQCDTKKEKAMLYPGFGEKLFSLVIANLPHGFAKDKKSVVAFLRDEANLCFDPSCTYAWLKGDVVGTKSLTPDNFKRILLFFIGMNELNSIDEIHRWVALGPRRYEMVICSDEVQMKLRSKNMLKDVTPCEEMAERQRLWAQLIQRVLTFSAERNSSVFLGNHPVAESNLIIIQGPPGFGKTTFLNRLWSDPAIRGRFDLVFHASCDPKMSPEVFLEYCFRKLIPLDDWCPGHPIVSKDDLQKAIQGKRIMLLADNLSTPEEIKALKPLCELGCLLVVATRSLDVARQVNYSNVVELTAYSKDDVLEYYSKNLTTEFSHLTQEKMIQLADLVRYNPLGLNIALRRVAEEGCENVMKKIRMAPTNSTVDVFQDLHKPLWLAYSSLDKEDQKKVRSLGALPNLANYDEEQLSWFWGVPKAMANEILVRLEKEAGLVHRDSHQHGIWHIHPQVLNYARFQMNASPFRDRCLFRFYSARMALRAKRLDRYPSRDKKGVKFDVLRTYWRFVREESRRKRMPILLAELRRLVDPSFSTDWSIFTQLTSNCTLEDYALGYRNYLEGTLDIWFFFIYLAVIGVLGGLQRLGFTYGLLKETSVLLGMLNLFLLCSAFIWMMCIILRDLRRRYTWGHLWQKITVNHREGEI